jgi:hypothetical protein
VSNRKNLHVSAIANEPTANSRSIEQSRNLGAADAAEVGKAGMGMPSWAAHCSSTLQQQQQQRQRQQQEQQQREVHEDVV